MYWYLHLHNCANAPKKYMRAHHTHMYSCSLSHKCTITHTRTVLFMQSLTHSVIHSLTRSLARSHIFTLFNSHSLSLFVTSMLIQAHSHMLMHILSSHTITYLHGLTQSCALIILFSHTYTHTCAYTHALTHTECMCMCKFGYACVRMRVCD